MMITASFEVADHITFPTACTVIAELMPDEIEFIGATEGS